ncbi:PLD nuclease N-terminal domain-containing protein [Streptomyces mangrovisoli]|uniref:Cardiolipin synthase N-terminal domain-containing protein n=1 Tax=Streptomyces mangrovisoli TaxID=1428628 RepID=A0A1J4NWS8_9ACTN|nr:PLD nuclease N-terminal domain-containing protein [Streptomyces mangrovisoli]OIJ66768.1 hypothetical protein WN71_016500 [Streptomyces mangrovisoli]
MLSYLPYLLVLALWIYAFVDCLNTPEEEVRGLPKVIWVIVILLFGEVLVGPVAWLLAGKVRRAPADGTTPGPASPGTASFGAAAPGRREPAAVWVAPDDNPEFLKSLGGPKPAADDKPAGDALPPGDAGDETRLRQWEADLRRREEELRRRESGEDSDG